MSGDAAVATENCEGFPVPVEFSQDALADEFSQLFAGELKYVPAWHCWLKWAGFKWDRDDRRTEFRLARNVIQRSASALRAADRESEARKLANAANVAGIVQLACADPRHVCVPDQLDADSWSINTPGGVVDLRTFRIRTARPGEMHTKAAGAGPSRDVKWNKACPQWLRFLDEICQGDRDLLGYLQRWVGYTLTGSVREEKCIFLVGPGGNGKSVFLDTISALLGDYSTVASSETFVVSRGDRHPTELAALRGARLVTVSEIEPGKQWAEAKLKALTGGDKITARWMRGDFFEYAPQFKLWFAANSKPSMKNPDDAMRRRLVIVPLTYIPREKNLELKAALLTELPGILRWGIRGCQMWQEEGLAPPAVVQQASAEYFDDVDRIGAWVAEHCEPLEGAKTSSSALFGDWVAWSRSRGEEPGTQADFVEQMKRRFTKGRLATGNVFHNVRLLKRESEFSSE